VVDGVCQDGYASPHAALNYRGHLVVTGMNLINDGAERDCCGTPVDAMVQRFKSGYLLSRTTRYCPYESSRFKRTQAGLFSPCLLNQLLMWTHSDGCYTPGEDQIKSG